eukprot:CAMPEP_0202900416 /NCGR_PEP_ID=MMETSP1392-20130828/11552_1 /ASSEMBLY_ACC=CAM_ASM_000868 /TAXON_ID=225041 /ORGANISM="Chlamydomonas chlamydogama, Strain SAG 11-48b" /LENGTH=268 /DNA_ID=CAMNT_0049586799 /DNA_START=53 /DNA_END=859 /DNA_ORIENTATION=+
MQSLNMQRCQAKPAAGRARSIAPRTVVLRAPRSNTSVCVRAAAFAPPTVADTKAKFLKQYNKPVASLYNTVIQELLVQQHFMRYSVNYQYNEVFALGCVSVFEQILESMNADERAKIFSAYITALGEDPEKYRKDAAALESAASSLSGPEQLSPDASGSKVQTVLSKVADMSAGGKLSYNKFFAIGLFRLLELTGAKEPSALERLVKSVNVKPEAVNRDLMLYKGILSKLAAAKELMKEFLEREKRKQAEREADKAAKAAQQNSAVQA